MYITNKKEHIMKQQLGSKVGILYKRNWSLFLFSIILAIIGIILFQTHIWILCIIGMMLFSVGIYYLLDLLFSHIVIFQNGFCVKHFLCTPVLLIPYHEIDVLECERRKYYFLVNLHFSTYYHFIHKPYDTLFTVSEKEYHNLSFLLDKMNMVTFQK